MYGYDPYAGQRREPPPHHPQGCLTRFFVGLFWISLAILEVLIRHPEAVVFGILLVLLVLAVRYGRPRR